MKKIITVVMVIVLLTIFSISSFTLYSGSKQISTANNVFDNTVELLKSRSFSDLAIQEIVANGNEHKFTITKKTQVHYLVNMKYSLSLFGNKESKTIESDIYIAR